MLIIITIFFVPSGFARDDRTAGATGGYGGEEMEGGSCRGFMNIMHARGTHARVGGGRYVIKQTSKLASIRFFLYVRLGFFFFFFNWTISLVAAAVREIA